MIPAIHDYHEAGFRVFALHTIIGGRCACGDERCEAVGKHPAISSWQTVPHWSDEQIDVLMQYQVETGFGVCIDDQLVIDVDPRNGGTESLAKLETDLGLDFRAAAGFVVRTGGAGLHIYFKRPAGAFLQHLPAYPGIDFKSSGFVVGAGSLHKSGNEYEAIKGFPQDLLDAPAPLLALLARPEMTRVIVSGRSIDVAADDVAAVVESIPNNDLHYDEWLRVGMGIHHATAGEGFALWLQWSAQSKKHDPDHMDKKWHSFGKSANPVTFGTLLHIAEAAGYVRPVTFAVSEQSAPAATKPGEMPFDVRGYDVKRPPGFVGRIVKWMAGNSYSEPLEHLNVASALVAVGNAVGLHTTDDMTRVSTNLLVLCVAESASGKEAVISSYSALMKAAGLSATIAGGIKSKQEIVRNLIEHQAANLLQDELGEVLRTIENAKKRGGAAYLEGITGELMSIFTKANGNYFVSGDVRRDLIAALGKELAQCNKLVDENTDSSGRFARKAESLAHAMDAIAFDGLFRPYLSLIGYSVPGSLECIMSEEMAKNGFLSRALLVIEERDNPKPIIGATGPKPVPEDIVATLRMLSTGGNFDAEARRIEYLGEKRAIRTEPRARDLLNRLRQWEWEYAEHHREHTGYTPLIRRAFEMISKISTILAAPEGVRTAEHVEWAACYVRHDLDRKIRHIMSVQANEAAAAPIEVQGGIEARIINLCQRDGGELESVIVNRCIRRKGVVRDEVRALIADMVSRGLLQHVGGACNRFAAVV